MDVGEESWEPANLTEAALRRSLSGPDRWAYLGVLAEAVLLLPVADPERAQAGDLAGALATGTGPDGRTVVPAYTSTVGLAGMAGAGAVGHVELPFTSIAAGWPDPEWILTVNPGTPIATHLAGEDLAEVVRVVFAPANAAEEAIAGAYGDDVVGALLATEVHVPLAPGGSGSRDLGDPEFPWRLAADGDATIVPVYTSERRLRGSLGVEHPDVDFVVVDVRLLAEAWPDEAWAMAVNPGTPLAIALSGETVRQLA